ncbi:hypothetical protein E8E13_001730 [Curvularia kusanoi]|uniref:Uncharacterized protein n=1 Tax=Curvularia kusanoi TaxID=90978 RepID=A0A9P4TGW7_CURKU|nr:hypothetical protein E8E13_001730 [Curvularia kusanoi]
MPGGVLAAIYEEWRRSFVDPNFEFGHFFATPVRITATGPSSLPEILTAHISLCDQAQHISLDMDIYSVHPLLPAAILVCDRLVEGDGLGPDGCLGLRELAREQIVLVILTGANRISTDVPITLESLEPFALPIERDNATGLDIRRVPLDIAVKFITELECKIDERNDTSSRVPDRSLCVHDTPDGYNRDVKCPLESTTRYHQAKRSPASRIDSQYQVECTSQDNGFYALLGTPNEASTLRMLRDHRSELSHRVVENVVVFGHEDITMEKPQQRSMALLLSAPRSPPSRIPVRSSRLSPPRSRRPSQIPLPVSRSGSLRQSRPSQIPVLSPRPGRTS